MINHKKDINWINVAKAICIIGVYFVHSQLYYDFRLGLINDFIHPIYVNAFFFVSGYLLFRKQLSEPLINEKFGGFAKGGLKTMTLNLLWKIAIPSTIFASMTYLPKIMVKAGNFDAVDFFWDTIGGGTYWFTSALIIAQLLIVVMLTTRWKSIWCYVVISLFLMFLGIYMANKHIIPWGLTHDLWMTRWGFLALPFLTAGGLYWRYEELIQRIMKWYILLSLIFIYAVVFLFFAEDVRVLVSMLDLNLYGFFAGCLGSVILIEICRYIPKIGFLTFTGQYSLGFYFMSGAVPIVMSLVVNKLLNNPTWYGFLVVFIGALIVSGFVTYLLNRFTPWLFDLRGLKKPQSYQ